MMCGVSTLHNSVDRDDMWVKIYAHVVVLFMFGLEPDSFF
jgi:hypothetical protein